VDSKGRVAVPVDFRRVLEANDPLWKEGDPSRLVIYQGPRRQNYLECYDMAQMSRIDEQFDALPDGHPNKVSFAKVFYPRSSATTTDDNGRLVLSPKLREKTGIGTDALFVGLGNCFQIWEPDAYEAMIEAEEDEEEQILATFGSPMRLLTAVQE